MKFMSLGASFRWLNITQFLGALNDNVFKLLMINFLIAASAAGPTAGGIAGTASLLFALPFLLFTPAAGALADRYSKRDIVVATKVLEIVVMAAGVVGVPGRLSAVCSTSRAFPDVCAERAVRPGQIRHHSRTGSARCHLAGQWPVGDVDLPGHHSGHRAGPPVGPLAGRPVLSGPAWPAWSSRWRAR